MSLSVETVRQLLDYDPETGVITWRYRPARFFKCSRHFNSWNARFAGNTAFTARNGDGYLSGCVLNYSVKAHRVAWAIAHGEWPDHVDHINGDRSDNRIENLRHVNNQENCRNQSIPRSNTSGVIGVSFHRPTNKWTAAIKVNRKSIHLGRFDDFDDAVAARKLGEARFGFHKNHGRASPMQAQKKGAA